MRSKLCVKMKGDETILFDPSDKSVEPRKFTFDKSFWSHDGYVNKKGAFKVKDDKYADQ